MSPRLRALLYLPSEYSVVGFDVDTDPLEHYLRIYGQNDGASFAFEKLARIVERYGTKSTTLPPVLLATLHPDDIDAILIALHDSPERFMRQRLFLKCEGLMSHDLIEIENGVYRRIVGMNPFAYLARNFENGRWCFQVLEWEAIVSGYRIVNVRATPQWLELQRTKKVS